MSPLANGKMVFCPFGFDIHVVGFENVLFCDMSTKFLQIHGWVTMASLETLTLLDFGHGLKYNHELLCRARDIVWIGFGFSRLLFCIEEAGELA